VQRVLPVGFGVQLDRAEEAVGPLGVGAEQNHVAWGEWGQVARVGGQWLGGEQGDAGVARQAAAGLREELRGQVEGAIAGLFARAGQPAGQPPPGVRVRVPVRVGGRPHTVTVRLVLGRLRGPDGAAYVPAYKVEQHAQMGALPYNSTDLTHYQIGGTSSGFSNSRSTTLPLTEPTVALATSVLSPLSAGPSVVPGGGRSFGHYEGNNAGADRQAIHFRRAGLLQRAGERRRSPGGQATGSSG